MTWLHEEEKNPGSTELRWIMARREGSASRYGSRLLTFEISFMFIKEILINKSERPVDALAVKKYQSLTD